MKFYMRVVLLILHLMLFLRKDAEGSEIKSVQIIFRHGERPTETTWPPTSQLTEEGKKQMYNLGLYIRQRYSNILTPKFQPNEMLLISSEVERSIISANLVAYGVYNDKAFIKSTAWSNEKAIPYDPIPVKTLPSEFDRYLNHNFKCPRMLQLFSSAVTAFLETSGAKNSEFNIMPVQNTNIDEVPLNGLAMVAFVTIFSNYINALNLPMEACKLYGGSLLGRIVQGFRDKNSSRMTLYSAHDLPIYTIMKLLDIYDPFTLENPPFGSALIFELHEDSSEREIMKIFYRNNTEVKPYELQFRACGSTCLLPNFVEKTKAFIPGDYEQECSILSENIS